MWSEYDPYILVETISTHFVDNASFSDMQINRWLHLSSSLWGI